MAEKTGRIKGNTRKANRYGELYVNLAKQAKKIEAQQERIKKKLIQEGTFETNRFTFDVSMVETNRTVDANTLLEALGPVVVTKHNLINKSSYKKLLVREKK